MLVTDGGQKEIQKDRIAGKPNGKLAQKTAIDPRESVSRWAADAIGDQDSFLNGHLVRLVLVDAVGWPGKIVLSVGCSYSRRLVLRRRALSSVP